MIVKLLTEHHLEFLSLKGGCRGSSESTLVKMPHCWKSHVRALIYFFRQRRQKGSHHHVLEVVLELDRRADHLLGLKRSHHQPVVHQDHVNHSQQPLPACHRAQGKQKKRRRQLLKHQGYMNRKQKLSQYVLQGTKIFKYCTCPAGRVTYNVH